MTLHRRLLTFAFLSTLVVALPAAGDEAEDWVDRSNTNAKILLDIMARFGPEGAARMGVDGLDEEIFQLPLNINEIVNAEVENAASILRARLKAESDPAVRQDLEILIEQAEQSIEGSLLNEKYMLPYFDLPQAIFQGMRALLDEQIPEERRRAALIRLRRYAGMAQGYSPITEQAEAYIRASLDNPKLRGPFKDNLEKDLANAPRFIDGIAQLFQGYGLSGYEQAYDTLKQQLADYDRFLRDEIMPRTSDDFRLPEELYRFGLVGVGIDMPLEELVSRAKVAFREIQNEMQALAQLVAQQRELTVTDYRDVIRVLKREQLVGKAILPHYQQRIKELEALIAQAEVVTLPEREMQVRLASDAESAAIPAPNMRPPRLIGNTGEKGEFVLPLKIPGEEGQGEVGFDDFTFEAASWTLTVHEGRPGHELQFSSIVEKGVSQTRILFALNSVNVEGWALYAEAEMKPLMPLEGQLISLQHRLLRAARAFLDPGLQLGTIDREQAYRILENDVVLSHTMAMQEVERYTFMAPGQATSYFCGYTRLMELRADAERLLGDTFNRREFHDFVLAQGLLPPTLLRKAVMEGFIEPQLATRTAAAG